MGAGRAVRPGQGAVLLVDEQELGAADDDQRDHGPAQNRLMHIDLLAQRAELPGYWR